MLSWLRNRRSAPDNDAQYQAQLESLRKQAPVPEIWLFGKTGSGKSSVVRYLTGASDAVIGEGYRPETKASSRFDFPNATERLLSFLDTRGIGEASYDPAEDIAAFSQTTQLIIVTVRVADHSLEGLLQPLRRIRKTDPQRPVLLVLTCLHESMANDQDISAGLDPFDSEPDTNPDANPTPGPVASPVASPIPERLATLIDQKRQQFAGLFDAVIPIDLTRLEDGFADPDFGGQRLRQSILDQLPQAYRQAVLALHHPQLATGSRQRAHWQVLASSALAGTAGAVPVPWVDIPVVLAIQTHLAVKIAKIYGQEITPARWAILSSAAGSRIAVRLAIREALKFIPLLGIAAGAAASFAFTYALGMSWDWFFADLRRGNVPTTEQLQEVFGEQLKRGHQLWRAS
ncbi:GTPase family protein [Planctomycetes bacterium K23_9]|uniref:G domain-containing protein n=1 Tax=Stieleria marina TaxID=1930275 RepID=A0A517NYX4_9BACT|nr:hypothetical protein K239x_43430 [Planctomycetes bacterium K23_9]